jgi:ankyrin repeat protein
LEKSPSFVEKFSPILDDLVALGLDIDETSYDGTTFLLKIVEELDSKEIVQ